MKRSTSFGNWLCVAAFVLCLSGCASGLHVKQLRDEKTFGDTYASAIDRGELSAPVYGLLVLMGLEQQWRADPDATLQAVVENLYKQPSREALYAVTELSFLCARSEKRTGLDRESLHLAAAFYAYQYLFGPGFGPAPSAYDPRLIVVTELYNRALASFGEANVARVARDATVTYPLPRGQLILDGSRLALPFGAAVADATFHNAYRLNVKGANVLSNSYGVGGALVVGLPAGVATLGDRTLQRPFAVPISVTLDAAGGLLDATGDCPVYNARLALHDAMAEDTLAVERERIPLAADYTASLAMTVGQGKSAPFLLALLRPEIMQQEQGFVLLHPYERGKIPVIFVHGLMSVPRTWVPMFNGLLSDPTIRERYQFWFFLYPTGNPAAYSAHLLRKDLARLRDQLDPGHTDPALDRIVLVGHSMGGLISHMVMLDSGDDVWNGFSDKPFDSLDLPDADRDLLRDVFFWEPLPYVKRVVFIATPHRGSNMALGGIGRFGRSLIRLPFEVASPAVGLFAQTGALEGIDQKKWAKAIPNSIDSLSPDNPMFPVMDQKQIVVPHHSIIGDKRAAGRTDGSDGIVPYWSSHLDSAESELVVKSRHNAHKAGPAINEVRRILLKYAAEWPAVDGSVERVEQVAEPSGGAP